MPKKQHEDGMWPCVWCGRIPQLPYATCDYCEHVCRHCHLPRKEHKEIEGFQVCPTSIFSEA